VKTDGTLLLRRRDVASLLSIGECMTAVEQAFKLYGQGKATPPGMMGIHAKEGGFHIKAGVMDLSREYFAAKINANFPHNMHRFGLPMIQGLVVLFDADNGYPLAVLDSSEITIKRTGAATAIAAKYLARPDATVVTICGCGNQGAISLRALAGHFPLTRVFAFDKDLSRAERFAHELSTELQINVEAAMELDTAVRASDICITCTPSKEPYLNRDFVTPGTFVAAVGADSPEKHELDPELLARNKVVVDVLDQCAGIGELHHALDAGLLMRDNVHAELGEVIAGVKPGRNSDDEIIVFDSTGMALQDVVAAAAVYEKASVAGIGTAIDFSL
jgi:alanine dehydrogenase